MTLPPDQVSQALSILDTTVKVGIGAAITGLMAFALEARKNRHDLIRERFHRRLDRLESIGLAIEGQHKISIDFSAKLHSICALLKSEQREHASDTEYEQLSLAISTVPEAMLSIHRSEGIAYMIGCRSLAVSLEEFRIAFSQFQLGLLGKPLPQAREDLGPLALQIEELRKEIYEIIYQESKRL